MERVLSVSTCGGEKDAEGLGMMPGKTKLNVDESLRLN